MSDPELGRVLLHYLVYNSKAGRGRMPGALDIVRAFFERHDLPLELLPAETGPALRDRLLGLPPGSTVLSLGGDGTVNGLLEALVPAQLVLGILPAGSADDFASALGFPRDNLEPALRAVLEGKTRLVDSATASLTFADGDRRDFRFLNALGTGFDAEVAQQREERFDWLRGEWGYYTALALGWLRMRREQLKVVVDGSEVWSGRALLVSCQNGPRTGGSFHLAPGARVDDGELELIVAGNVSHLGLLKLLPKVLGAQLIEDDRVRRVAGREFRLEWAQPRTLHMDGEIQPAVTSAHIQLQPASLRVIVPD